MVEGNYRNTTGFPDKLIFEKSMLFLTHFARFLQVVFFFSGAFVFVLSYFGLVLAVSTLSYVYFVNPESFR